MQITRRSVLSGVTAAAPMTFTGRTLAGWEPSERYPDPAIQVLDPDFAKYRLALAGVERLVTGMRWCEGPVYFGDARCLLWSDIPNNRIMRSDRNLVAPASTVRRRISPTATRATARDGWSPASTIPGASRVPSTMERSLS